MPQVSITAKYRRHRSAWARDGVVIWIFNGNFGDYTIGNVTNEVQAAGNPELEVLLVGRGPMAHSGEVLVGQSNRLLGTVEFNEYESFKFIEPIEWTDIAADGTPQGSN